MFLLTITLCMGSNTYAAKVIKWVDANGVTHYGDKPPAQSSKSHAQTIEKKPEAPKVNKEDTAQKRYDNALLSTFSSVEEIEMARKRNVELDKLSLQSLEKRYAKLKEKTKKNKQSNSSDMALLQNLSLQIDSKRAAIAAINKRYKQDKIRYLELTTKTR